jgi:hypothetical protein
MTLGISDGDAANLEGISMNILEFVRQIVQSPQFQSQNTSLTREKEIICPKEPKSRVSLPLMRTGFNYLTGLRMIVGKMINIRAFEGGTIKLILSKHHGPITFENGSRPCRTMLLEVEVELKNANRVCLAILRQERGGGSCRETHNSRVRARIPRALLQSGQWHPP